MHLLQLQELNCVNVALGSAGKHLTYSVKPKNSLRKERVNHILRESSVYSVLFS